MIYYPVQSLLLIAVTNMPAHNADILPLLNLNILRALTILLTWCFFNILFKIIMTFLYLYNQIILKY